MYFAKLKRCREHAARITSAQDQVSGFPNIPCVCKSENICCMVIKCVFLEHILITHQLVKVTGFYIVDIAKIATGNLWHAQELHYCFES